MFFFLCFLVWPYNKHLIKLGRSVWENLDLRRWYRPQCVRSVLATLVKILPYRPPARLIRAIEQFIHFVKMITLDLTGGF